MPELNAINSGRAAIVRTLHSMGGRGVIVWYAAIKGAAEKNIEASEQELLL